MDQERPDALTVVFMGSPDFAAASLDKLLAWDGARVAGVYTQPDRPCGRGRQCRPTPVKELALDRNLPVYQPENFKDQGAVEELKALAPDVLAVAAYGLILPQAVLDIPKHGALNVHASLLPRWRGASPIQAALLAGDRLTGVTIMRMEAGLDTGPILLQRALGIAPDEHAGQIHDQLAEQGGEILVEALDRLRQGRLVEIPQDESKATYAPKLTKDQGHIDWTKPAREVHNIVRAMYPWPGAFFDWDQPGSGKTLRLALEPGKVGGGLEPGTVPGAILGCVDDHVAIACADKAYLAPRVKPRGKKALDAKAFECGYLNNCR